VMDVAQGVHDALTLYSSQRPGEECEIEAPSRDADLGRSRNLEAHLVRELGRKRLTGQPDSLFVRVDCVDRSGRVRDLQRHAAVAAPELEHVQPVHRSKLPKGADLDTFRIDLHQPILARRADGQSASR
jgi:hypothetical protein